jgi:hypothetical protein
LVFICYKRPSCQVFDWQVCRPWLAPLLIYGHPQDRSTRLRPWLRVQEGDWDLHPINISFLSLITSFNDTQPMLLQASLVARLGDRDWRGSLRLGSKAPFWFAQRDLCVEIVLVNDYLKSQDFARLCRSLSTMLRGGGGGGGGGRWTWTGLCWKRTELDTLRPDFLMLCPWGHAITASASSTGSSQPQLPRFSSHALKDWDLHPINISFLSLITSFKER